MTSRPLLARVEESIVTLAPISQLGCFKASLAVIFASSSLFLPLKGPPEAVSRIFSTSSSAPPLRDWNIAECSESTGSILTLCSFARGIIMWPAQTRVSLLARAISFPAFMASMTGSMPIIPTIAPTTISASSSLAASIMPSIPESTLVPVSASDALSSPAASSS